MQFAAYPFILLPSVKTRPLFVFFISINMTSQNNFYKKKFVVCSDVDDQYFHPLASSISNLVFFFDRRPSFPVH